MPQLAQGVHLLPLDALRTFNLASICWCRAVFQFVLVCTRSKAMRTFSGLHSLKVEEDFLLPALAQSRGGLFLACTRSKSMRTFSCLHSLLPALARGRGGLFPFLACTRSRARRSFFLFRLHSLEGEEVFFSFSPALARGRGGIFLFLPQDARER